MQIHLSKRGRLSPRPLLALLATAALVLTLGAAPTSAEEEAQRTTIGTRTGWPQPNADEQATRNVASPINSGSVSRLTQAWTAPIVGNAARWSGGYASTPVVVNGVAYSQDLDSNVYAIDLQSGRTLWTTMYSDTSNGPNGVAVSDGRVYANTQSFTFALDARTGKELWRHTLVRNSAEGIDMAPGVHDGVVYVSTVPGNYTTYYTGGAQGVLWALDGRTGATKWTWETVPSSLWGNPDINSGGGLWYPPSFDGRGGVYLAVSNPGPFPGTNAQPWGASRPGPNLYTNSIVKLDTATGKMLWYYQVLPHDIYDWDLQNSPILTTVQGRPVVIATGKVGIAYAFDQQTGALIWKTPLGQHNGHDNDNLFAMNGQTDKLPAMPTGLIYPGVLGGEITPGAIDCDTLYVAATEYPISFTDQGTPNFPEVPSTGEIIAVDLATGRIKWQHPLPTTAYGSTTVTNDLVFTTLQDGTVLALNTRTGETAWQAQLPAATVGSLAIVGDTLITAAGWPQAPDQKAEFVAYRLTRS